MTRTNHQQPDWMKQGIVMAGEWHSLARYSRDRTGSKALAEHHNAIHIEETVIRMKERGVNLIISPFYFGFGVEAERAEMEKAVTFASLCRKHGLRNGIYIQTLGSIMLETLLHEDPSAKDWVSVDQDGKTPTYRDRWRPIPCPNCEEFITYIEEKVLRFALDQVGPNLIHFDNFRWWGEPEACRCPRCTDAFRTYLFNRWPDKEERRLHFGIDDFTFCEIPHYHWTVQPWQVHAVLNPLMKAWHDYKCHRLGELYGRFCSFIRAANPEIAVELNIDEPPCSNTVINRGSWSPSVYPHGDIFWTEEKNFPSVDEDGILVSRIRSYKKGQATGNRVFAYTDKSALAKIESMVFNPGCLGMVGWLPDAPPEEQDQAAINFYHDHSELYTKANSAAEVCIFNSYPALSYTTGKPHLQLALTEQVLLQHQIPWDTLFDLSPETMAQYHTIILPATEGLSEVESNSLKHFTANGGKVILVGDCGRFTEFRTLRKTPLFTDLSTGFTAVPNLAAKAPAGPEIAPTNWIRSRIYDQRWWSLPDNASDLIETLGQCNLNLNVDSGNSRTVIAELTEQKDRERSLLHLIQYDTSVQDTTLSVTIPNVTVATAKPLTVHSYPDNQATSVPTTQNGESLQFQVSLKTYTIVELPMLTR